MTSWHAVVYLTRSAGAACLLIEAERCPDYARDILVGAESITSEEVGMLLTCLEGEECEVWYAPLTPASASLLSRSDVVSVTCGSLASC